MMRLYTKGGGLLRLTYTVEDIAGAVRRDTQFIGRTLRDEQGGLLLERMAGPDDHDFIYAGIKDSVTQYEAMIPKHLKGDDVLMLSQQQLTIVLKDKGMADRGILEQVHRHTLVFIAHMVVKTWFERIGMQDGANSHAMQATSAMGMVQRIITQTLLRGREHGSRHPKIDPQLYAQPLGGKFLGGYSSLEHLAEVHQTSMTKADIAYIEALSAYVVYDGGQWRTVGYLTEQAISLGRVIDASVPDAAFPSTGKGKMFYITKGGNLAGVKVSAGDVLLAIADNAVAEQSEDEDDDPIFDDIEPDDPTDDDPTDDDPGEDDPGEDDPGDDDPGDDDPGDDDTGEEDPQEPEEPEITYVDPETAVAGDYILHEGLVYGVIEKNGLLWLDRNLGAENVAEAVNDPDAYGDVYQWGRGKDGHEQRDSGTTVTLTSSDTPPHGNFIMFTEISIINEPHDWRTPQKDELWQGAEGVNNPAPSGWRLPTEAELLAERDSWAQQNRVGAFASVLRWTTGGYRKPTGLFSNVGVSGEIWSSTTSNTLARFLRFNASAASMYGYFRSTAKSVRCVKDIPQTPVSPTGDNIVKILDVSSTPSGTVKVDVEVINDSAFTAFMFDINLPDGFTFVSGSYELSERADGHSKPQSLLSGNVLRIGAFAIPTTPFSGNDGVVASFELLTPASTGTFDVTFAYGNITGEGGTDIYTGNEPGVITITS
jgi:uncharacterized protein (TIGR02145 family)